MRTLSPDPDGSTGHHGWIFRGAARFQARAAGVLAQGLARGERLVFIADDPRPSAWPPQLLAQRTLLLASTAEVYGADKLVAPAAQLETFTGVCAEALDDGYRGICVVADNTGLVDSPERLEAWLDWEHVADEFMSSNPVTGICAFDETTTGPAVLRQLVRVHPVSLDLG